MVESKEIKEVVILLQSKCLSRTDRVPNVPHYDSFTEHSSPKNIFVNKHVLLCKIFYERTSIFSA